MKTITRSSELRLVVDELLAEGQRIGFVPTMGALHEGHLSLVRIAKEKSDVVIGSIFVNPTQFGAGEDLDRYPRNLEKDSVLLSELGMDYLFAPTREEIYPPGFKTYLNVEELDRKLEGASRPGHFRGVATVLSILFNLVRPKFVVMGQKDAQQIVVVKQMVRDMQIPLEIVVAPIVRESDGLALSSRNSYLSADERRAAPVLFRALKLAESAFNDGEREAKKLIALVRNEIEQEPSAKIDYIALTDAEELEPIELIDQRQALLSLAVRFGTTRLIDNILLQQ